MNVLFFLPLIIGLSVVAQGVLNRQIADHWGLSSTVFLNAIVFLVVSLLWIGFEKIFPQMLPDYLKQPHSDLYRFKWWFVVPGICGFLIVLGIPWSVQINGPSKTFIMLIASQIILSLLYEKFLMGSPLSVMKISGAFIAMFGTALVVMSPS